MITNPLFLENTFLFSILARIVHIGQDDQGCYFITDRSICYPQGGGQLGDSGVISCGRDYQVKIICAKYSESGIRHYTDTELPDAFIGAEVAMTIFQQSRK